MGKRIKVDDNNLSDLLNEYAEKEKTNKTGVKSRQIKEEITEVPFIKKIIKHKNLT